MTNVWLGSALWLGLALLASLITVRVAISVALVEIVVGAFAGNLIGLHITDWVNFLAGFEAILLTFLAGTDGMLVRICYGERAATRSEQIRVQQCC